MADLSVGLRELKTHLSEYMRQVKAGRTIVITEHGRPVGRIVPAPRSLDEQIQAMLDAGLAEWNGQQLPPLTGKRPRVRGKKTVADMLIEDRELILYADASLLVKRYIDESGSAGVVQLLDEPMTIGTALITRAEVAAALAKAVRLRALARSDAEQGLKRFHDNWSTFLRLRLNEAIIGQADELAWVHGLRVYDAVHLASALTWQAVLEQPLTLGTFDRQLWQAGQKVGLAVWPAAL